MLPGRNYRSPSGLGLPVGEPSSGNVGYNCHQDIDCKGTQIEQELKHDHVHRPGCESDCSAIFEESTCIRELIMISHQISQLGTHREVRAGSGV